MKKNVKIFCMALTMSLCVGGLTACGASTENQTADESAANASEVSSDTTLDDTAKETKEDTASAEGAGDNKDRANATTKEGKIKTLVEGDIAPDFTAKLVDGTEFTLSDHDNEVVLLNFFASWCGPCMGEMPAFEMLKDDGYSNLSILCVNCMEDKATVDALVKEEGFTFPIAYDENGDIGEYYPTEGIPYTLIIKNGVIEQIEVGASSAERQYSIYKEAIDKCME
ncbi:MAG: TlpA family protein disulfide reductase [Butyrivibrio sp.]|nr:TlpA family protein disulfide reductase [Butyrivibrio sp.]